MEFNQFVDEVKGRIKQFLPIEYEGAQVKIEEIKKFFKEVRDEEISDFEGTLVLDFFREKIASEFYNIGVSAAYRRLHEISEDILSILKY